MADGIGEMMADSGKMGIIRATIRELEEREVEASLSNVSSTILGPRTMSYVRYSDGELGCGCANNEAERAGILEEVSFTKSLLNLNVYGVFDKLESFESSVFTNSLRTSLASALSYRLINEGNELKDEGYDVEAFSAPNTPPFKPFTVRENFRQRRDGCFSHDRFTA